MKKHIHYCCINPSNLLFATKQFERIVMMRLKDTISEHVKQNDSGNSAVGFRHSCENAGTIILITMYKWRGESKRFLSATV